ncbi:MAG: alpha/beta fold hydrolase [Ruminococcus sp.]|nr:alpha/beta fold hydrolase [Ruminococcus sp.]
MKKCLAAVLAVVLALSAGACGKKKEDKKTPESSGAQSVPAGTGEEESSADTSGQETENTTDLAEMALNCSEEMAQGEFQPTADRLASMLKAQVSVDSLRETYRTAVEDAGEYLGVYSTESGEAGGYSTETVVLEYERISVKLTYSFSSSGAIVGLGLNYYIIPEESETDAYTETIVTVGDYELEGFLTLPKGVEEPPVVLLVQGSGQHNMNETVSPTVQPFEEIAHMLAERGIATLRVNKRYYQYPDIPEDATIQTEVLDDADAAIDFLLGADGVDHDRIFVLGHSQGGMLAPVIAENNAAVKGIISLAGTPRALPVVAIDQYTAMMNDPESDEGTKIQAKLGIEMAKGCIDPSPEDDISFLGFQAAYWCSFAEIDQGASAQRLEIPMLFLQGSDDIQVYADVDYVMWQELLEGKDNAGFKLYDGLGHFFNDKSGSTEPEVADDIAEFVLAN